MCYLGGMLPGRLPEKILWQWIYFRYVNGQKIQVPGGNIGAGGAEINNVEG
jgi:hypothetical protein